MTIKVFEKIADSLVESGTVSAEDKEIYEYGLKHIATMTLNIATTLIIGLVFGMVWQSVLFMVSYIPLRSYAGGYHARTPMRCYIASVVLTIAVLLSIKYIFQNVILISILTAVAGIIIFIFAPIGADNKPLDEIEIKIYKKRTQVILFAEIVIISLLMFLGFKTVAVSLAVSILCASIMIVFAVVKKGLRFKMAP